MLLQRSEHGTSRPVNAASAWLLLFGETAVSMLSAPGMATVGVHRTRAHFSAIAILTMVYFFSFSIF